jgi:tRNA threonylcarbamoyladenosine biosynthesis protein TsaE
MRDSRLIQLRTPDTVKALDLISHSAEQTQQLGALLAPLLRAGDVVCLEGSLGAGKTCLTQGIGRGLGVSVPMTSPTFVIVHEYALPSRTFRLYHIDLYRIQSTAEACATGLEDYFFGDGICVIEWADRIVDILPGDRLWITLRYVSDSQRSVLLQGHGLRYVELLQQLRGRLHNASAGLMG